MKVYRMIEPKDGAGTQVQVELIPSDQLTEEELDLLAGGLSQTAYVPCTGPTPPQILLIESTGHVQCVCKSQTYYCYSAK